jgi:predicted O-methyltransferase YrrM
MLRFQTIPFRSGLGDSAWMLYSLARSLKPEVCVEIGSARGKSACYIARALAENGKGKLYAIDPHTRTDWNDDDSVETYAVMRQNLEYLGLSDRVEIIRKTSQNAAQGWGRTIDLIFIDGDHSYEGVKRDWELFVPHVSPFGVVVFHDTAWDIHRYLWREYARDDMGVPRLVDELRLAGYPVITLTQDCGISMVQPQIGGAPLRISSTETAAVG